MGSRYAELGRRERQIMDVLFRRGRATAQDVLEDLPDPPSYSAVRGMLRLLETKGHVRHDWDGPRHVYLPPGSRADAAKPAARHVLGGGSAPPEEDVHDLPFPPAQLRVAAAHRAPPVCASAFAMWSYTYIHPARHRGHS